MTVKPSPRKDRPPRRHEGRDQLCVECPDARIEPKGNASRTSATSVRGFGGHQILEPGSVPLAQLRAIYDSGMSLSLSARSRDDMTASSMSIRELLKKGVSLRGINRGIGEIVHRPIGPAEHEHLPRHQAMSQGMNAGESLHDSVLRMCRRSEARDKTPA